jgi:hypothetical protein
MSKLSILSARLDRSEDSIRSFLTYHGISRKSKTVDELYQIILDIQNRDTLKYHGNKKMFYLGNDACQFYVRYEADMKRLINKMYWYFKNINKLGR